MESDKEQIKYFMHESLNLEEEEENIWYSSLIPYFFIV